MKTKEQHLSEYYGSVPTIGDVPHGYAISESSQQKIFKAMESYANQKVAEERDRIEKWILLNRYPEHIGEEDSYTALDYNDLAQFLSQPEAERVQEVRVCETCVYKDLEFHQNPCVNCTNNNKWQPLPTKPKEEK